MQEANETGPEVPVPTPNPLSAKVWKVRVPGPIVSETTGDFNRTVTTFRTLVSASVEDATQTPSWGMWKDGALWSLHEARELCRRYGAGYVLASTYPNE